MNRFNGKSQAQINYYMAEGNINIFVSAPTDPQNWINFLQPQTTNPTGSGSVGPQRSSSGSCTGSSTGLSSSLLSSGSGSGEFQHSATGSCTDSSTSSGDPMSMPSSTTQRIIFDCLTPAVKSEPRSATPVGISPPPTQLIKSSGYPSCSGSQVEKERDSLPPLDTSKQPSPTDHFVVRYPSMRYFMDSDQIKAHEIWENEERMLHKRAEYEFAVLDAEYKRLKNKK